MDVLSNAIEGLLLFEVTAYVSTSNVDDARLESVCPADGALLAAKEPLGQALGVKAASRRNRQLDPGVTKERRTHTCRHLGSTTANSSTRKRARQTMQSTQRTPTTLNFCLTRPCLSMRRRTSSTRAKSRDSISTRDEATAWAGQIGRASCRERVS